MAKAKAETMINKSGAKLIFPDGVELAPGVAIAMSKEYAENAGVQSWIDDGGLVSESDIPSEVVASLADLRAELEATKASLASVTAENEVLKAELATATAPAQ